MPTRREAQLTLEAAHENIANIVSANEQEIRNLHAAMRPGTESKEWLGELIEAIDAWKQATQDFLDRAASFREHMLKGGHSRYGIANND